MNDKYFVTLLVVLTSAVDKANSQLTTTVDVVVGSDAVLPCRSNLSKPVEWQSPGPAFDEIAFDGEVHQRHRDRFSLVEAPTGGGRNSLLIRSTRLNDSGEYNCVENNGVGTSHLVELVVRNAPTAQRNVNNLQSYVTTSPLLTSSTVNAHVPNVGPTQQSLLALVIGCVSLAIALLLIVVVVILLVYICRLRKRETGSVSDGLLNNNKTNGLPPA